MLSFKNILLVALAVLGVRYYMTHYYENGNFKAYKLSFENTCVKESSKGLEGHMVAAIKPLCACIVQKSEMQAALRTAYDTKDQAQGDKILAKALYEVLPLCLQDMGAPSLQ